MIVSWNWLKEYVDLDMPAEALAERLSLAGLNHESTEEVGGDLAIDLEVTSNRPDCLSHLGVAREVSVLYGRTLRDPDPRPGESGEPADRRASVGVADPDLCPRFTARAVSGVRIAESPWWLRKRLETLGIRPINNVVDITNYVLFECGQPLHAYDLGRLAGRRLVVRPAGPGESLVAINNKTYELTPEMLVIADAERPVGLAGVMGGLDTEIGPGTRDVLIESARFEPTSIRRTSRALGLFSPSSYRFERGLDPERTEWASRRCAQMILELAGGTLHPGVIDVAAPRPGRPAIPLRLDQIRRVLGIEIGRDRTVAILEALGLERVGDLTFRAPSWRADLEREIDLIEEVARIHGYEHIPEDRPVPLMRSARGRRERVETVVRETLQAAGFDEAVTFSLVPEALIVGLEPDGVAPAAPIRVEHSTRKKETLLRQSLVPSLLAARSHNEAHGSADADLFEIAHVYLPRGDRPLPDEPTHLGIVGGHDLPGMKGVVEALIDRLHAAGPLRARPADHPFFAAGRAAALDLDGTPLGLLGELSAEAREVASLREPCAAAELRFDLLRERSVLIPQSKPVAAYPAVARDLSLVVPTDLPWAELEGVARGAGGAFLESVSFLDTFRGGSIPEGWHSLHFGLRFRHPGRTLTGEEADAAVREVIDACARRFAATLRT